MNFLLFRSPIELTKPGSTTYGYDTKCYPPLGILYIAAVLLENGHNVEIIDLSFEKPSEDILQKKLLSTDAIGLEVYSDNYKNVDNYAKFLKKINPDIPLIIGGPHCIFFQKKSLNHIQESDIAVTGEAEDAIIEISNYLEGTKKISDISNIFFRENGKIKSGKSFKVIENIDNIPFPARHLIEKYDYDFLPKAFVYKKRLTLMESSRGCPYHCLFCSRYQNFIKDYGYRQRSAENVVEEILEIDKTYGSVMVIDDNFLADKKRAHRIFELLIENRTNIEILIMGARVDSAEKELYSKMKKANVTFISFGIESGNQDVLDFYNKNITLNQIKRAVSLSREMGFQTSGTIMFGAPIETEQHLKRTIKFIKSITLDFAIFTVLKYYKGSPLWLAAFKNGNINEDEFCVIPDSRKNLGMLSSEELIKFSKKAYTSFYLRPAYFFDQFRQAILKKDFWLFKNYISNKTFALFLDPP